MEEQKSVVITAGGIAVDGPLASSKRNKNRKKKVKKTGTNSKTTTTTDDDSRNNANAFESNHANNNTASIKDNQYDNTHNSIPERKAQNQQGDDERSGSFLEFEESTQRLLQDDEDPLASPNNNNDNDNNNNRGKTVNNNNNNNNSSSKNKEQEGKKNTSTVEDLYKPPPPPSHKSELVWLFFCFLGIMTSFVCYGILLEYTTSGGRKLHELSFLFVTSGLYTITAAAGRYVRDETPTTIPPARFAILGLTSMGSTFCSVRSLRYVIYPIQVLAKSCKPVPVMIMGAFMGKKYPLRKYLNVVLIVLGVALFMSRGSSKSKGHHSTVTAASANNTTATNAAEGNTGEEEEEASSSGSQILGICLLFISLCFDGGTGAYEDKLMSVHSVGPFDLMYNIQLGKTILAGIGLLVLNQMHIFVQMCQEMGFLLVALGLSGALGQVFIFITIAKFGALTCSIIGLSRKVTTLVASIYVYGHHLNGIQFTGLLISVGAMVMNFWRKKEKKSEPFKVLDSNELPDEMKGMLGEYKDEAEEVGDVELATTKR